MKNTCKQAIFRRDNKRAKRVVDLWREEIKIKGELEFFNNAFLNGDLEHEIYTKIPEGYDEVKNEDVDKEDCLIVQKAIYGLVQAARQFWKKNLADKIQEGGFQLSEADPCMLYKEDEKGIWIINRSLAHPILLSVSW